jgi:hypothetical protein
MATILAIDLGKYKSVICRLDTDTGEASFEKVTTTPREIGRLHAGDASTCEYHFSPSGLPTSVRRPEGEKW